jgi:hypothetical protein
MRGDHYLMPARPQIVGQAQQRSGATRAVDFAHQGNCLEICFHGAKL